MNSSTGIPTIERLIVALDFPTAQQALDFIILLDSNVKFYKVGLELFSSGDGLRLIDELARRQLKVFADLKFFDVPETVYRAVRNLNGRQITFLTVHAEEQTMKAAVSAAEDFSILAVSVLTSLGSDHLKALGHIQSTKELVCMRSIQAHECGCVGVIASPRESQKIREVIGDPSFSIITPGIRPAGKLASDDQVRTTTPYEAIRSYSDYIVVGRPIRDSNNPKQAVKLIQSEIATAIEQRSQN